MKMVVGITGSIASGKSLVTDRLISLGYKVIDSDSISRNITKKNEIGYKKIAEYFPECIKEDLELDRKKLGDIIFDNKEKRELLNSIIHPLVKIKIDEEIKNSIEDIIFVDVPLLYEAKMEDFFNHIILVYVDKKTELDRLMKRDNISEKLALKKINSQIDIEAKKLRADFIVDNNNDIRTTYNNLENILKKLEI